ncbi:MAG: hypothetical protein AAFY98_01455 [Verrucomicrobiota bacterium]
MKKALILVSIFIISYSAQAGLKGVRSIAVPSSVPAPKYFGYVGTTNTVLFGLSAFGGANNSDGDLLASKLKNRGFSISSTFRSDLIRELGKSKYFSYAGSSGGTKARLDVREWGVVVAPTGFKRLKPELEASVVITTNGGKKVYSKVNGVGIMDDSVEGATFEQYRDNPSKLERDFRTLSKMVAARMIKGMERSAGSSSSTSSSSSSAVKMTSKDKYRTK